MKIRNKKVPTKGDGFTSWARAPGDTSLLTTIGGTLAKSIVGVNKWQTQRQAFFQLMGKEKNGLVSNAALVGQYLERPLIQMVADNPVSFGIMLPWKEVYVTSLEYLRERGDDLILSAHIDGWGVDEQGNNFLIEAKNYSAFAHKGYRDVEESELIQIHHYFNVFGSFFDYAILIVRVDNQVRTFRVEKDGKVCARVAWEISKFWTEHWLPKVTPPAEAGDVEDLKDEEQKGVELVIDKNERAVLDQFAEEYYEVTQQANELKKKKESLRAKIMERMRGHNSFSGEKYRIRQTVFVSSSVDQALLKADGNYEKYSKVHKVARLTVSELK